MITREFDQVWNWSKSETISISLELEENLLDQFDIINTTLVILDYEVSMYCSSNQHGKNFEIRYFKKNKVVLCLIFSFFSFNEEYSNLNKLLLFFGDELQIELGSKFYEVLDYLFDKIKDDEV